MSTLFDSARVLACLYLPVPFVMLWLHGFHRVRGIVGRRWYALHAVVYAALVAATASLGPLWPALAWPFPVVVRACGAVLIAAALALLAGTYFTIDSWTAMAGPQTTGARDRRLVTGGVYGRIRHPRYTVLFVGSLGNFLLTGAPLLLAAAAVTIGLSLLVVHFEERELTDYFGDAYRRYRRTVPAFFPSPRRWRGPADDNVTT